VEAVFSHSQARQFKENAFVRDMLAVWECWDRTKQAFACDVDEARARTQRPPPPWPSAPTASPAPVPPPARRSRGSRRNWFRCRHRLQAPDPIDQPGFRLATCAAAVFRARTSPSTSARRRDDPGSCLAWPDSSSLASP
jgi:hypothetical protein